MFEKILDSQQDKKRKKAANTWCFVMLFIPSVNALTELNAAPFKSASKQYLCFAQIFAYFYKPVLSFITFSLMPNNIFFIP